MIEVRYVEGVEDGIDFDAAYTIGKPDVAWRLLGWAQEWEQATTLITVMDDDEADDIEIEVESEEPGDGDWIDNRDRVVAVMVGDDTRYEFDKDEPVVIPDDGFCRGCGQVGCTSEVYA